MPRCFINCSQPSTSHVFAEGRPARPSATGGLAGRPTRRRQLASAAPCRLALAIGFVTLAMAHAAAAAEIKLRSECRCSQSLVRLGDVAEIHAAAGDEAAQLEQLELFPAPPQGQPRHLRVRELQDLLALRGLNLAQHRLSGASRVEICGAEEPKAASKPFARPLTTSMMMRAEELVKKTVLAYLQQQVSASEPWRVEIKLEQDAARAVFAASHQPLNVQGGEPPYRGRQRMTLVVPGEEGEQSFEIEPLVSVAPMVAVAARSLAPGDNVQATDVKLVQVSTRQVEDPFYRLEDLIGQQAIGAIVEGQVIDRGDVRAPLLVRRGDAVTVYARSAGVQVRTTGRAQEEGSRGELITVESLLNRQRFFARVTGIHEVEVFASALEVPASAVPASNFSSQAPAARSKTASAARGAPRRTAAPPETFSDPHLKPAGFQAGVNDRPFRRAP